MTKHVLADIQFSQAVQNYPTDILKRELSSKWFTNKYANFQRR